MSKDWWIGVLSVAVLIVSAYSFSRKYKKSEPTIVTRTDTLIIRDTVRISEPRYVTRYVTRVDSVPYYISDTVKIYIPVPIERKEYRGETYHAVVEGYKAELTSIETYTKTAYITNDKTTTVKTSPKWGVGVQVGYGTDFRRFYPYLGVGVQYNIITW